MPPMDERQRKLKQLRLLELEEDEANGIDRNTTLGEKYVAPAVNRVTSLPGGLARGATLGPLAAISEMARGKDTHVIEDFIKTATGDAPRSSEYLNRMGVPQMGQISDVAPSLFRPAGSEPVRQTLGNTGISYVLPEKGGPVDITGRGAIGGILDIISDLAGFKAASPVAKKVGDAVYSSAPAFKKTNALLKPGQKPIDQIVKESGRIPESAQEIGNILEGQKASYEAAKNQIKTMIAEANVEGDIKGGMARAQEYVNKMAGNRELQGVQSLLQKEIDDQIAKLSKVEAVPPRAQIDFVAPKKVQDIEFLDTMAKKPSPIVTTLKNDKPVPLATHFRSETDLASFPPRQRLVPDYTEIEPGKLVPDRTVIDYPTQKTPVFIDRIERDPRIVNVPGTQNIPEGHHVARFDPGTPGRPAASPWEIDSAKTGASSKLSPEDFNKLQRSGILSGFQKAKAQGLKEELARMAEEASAGSSKELANANEGLSSIYRVGRKLGQQAIAEGSIPAMTEVDAMSLFEPKLWALKQFGKVGKVTAPYTRAGTSLSELSKGIDALAPYSPWLYEKENR